MAFYTSEEVRRIGFRRVGKGALISRDAKIYRPENISIGDHSRIDDFVTLTASPEGVIDIGSYVHLAAYSMVESSAGVVFKDFSGLAARVTVYGSSDDYLGMYLTNPCVPLKHRSIRSELIQLGQHAVVGTGSVLLPGAMLGDGVAVGAMSLVSGSLEPFGVYVGVPVRRVKERSRALLEREAEVRSANRGDGR